MKGRMVALVAVVALAAILVACGGEQDGDEAAAEIKTSVQEQVDAWNSRDVDAWLALGTDNYIRQFLGRATTREEAAQVLPQLMRFPPVEIEILELSDIEASGDSATAVGQIKEAQLSTRQRRTFVREDGQWKLDSIEYLTVNIPNGVTAVDVALTEYRINFDAGTIQDGNIAFNVSNIGTEEHELNLVKAPLDLGLEGVAQSFQQAEQSGEWPSGIEYMGIVVLGPEAETAMVFAEPLEAGSYFMFCFVQAADGEIHSLKGERAEFTIE